LPKGLFGLLHDSVIVDNDPGIQALGDAKFLCVSVLYLLQEAPVIGKYKINNFTGNLCLGLSVIGRQVLDIAPGHQLTKSDISLVIVGTRTPAKEHISWTEFCDIALVAVVFYIHHAVK